MEPDIQPFNADADRVFVQPVVQTVVSCKRTLTIRRNGRTPETENVNRTVHGLQQ